MRFCSVPVRDLVRCTWSMRVFGVSNKKSKYKIQKNGDWCAQPPPRERPSTDSAASAPTTERTDRDPEAEPDPRPHGPGDRPATRTAEFCVRVAPRGPCRCWS